MFAAEELMFFLLISIPYIPGKHVAICYTFFPLINFLLFSDYSVNFRTRILDIWLQYHLRKISCPLVVQLFADEKNPI